MKRLSVIDAERCVGCQSCMFACSRRLNKPGLAQSSIGVRSNGGMERGFVVVVCRACEDPPCARACPTGALVPNEGGGVRLREEKCIGCGNCTEACIVRAVYWDSETNKPMICIQCGFCVDYCPHDVIELAEKKVGNHA